MSVTDPPLATPAPSGRTPRSRRVAWLLLAGAVGIGAAALALNDRAPTSAGRHDEQAVHPDPDRQGRRTPGRVGRQSDDLPGATVPGTTAPSEPGGITTTTSLPSDRASGRGGRTGGDPGAAPAPGHSTMITLPLLPGGAIRPARPGTPGTTPARPATPISTTAPFAPRPRPSPSSFSSPVAPEPVPRPGGPRPDKPGTATTVPSTTSTSTTTTTTSPAVDEERCPTFSLVAIGALPPDPSPQLTALAPRFRELAAAELTNPNLVCAHPIETWRDLAIQRLVTAGQADGSLITATDGSSIVLRLSEVEWTAYRFRGGGSPTGVNFLGFPVGRQVIGGLPVIRTTRGGLVLPRNDTIGIPVVGGAWEYWMANGGPAGPMGRPESIPTGFVTPLGAYQDFTNGWIWLPGVATEIEAWVQPPSRYEWHPSAAYTGPVPADTRNTILQTNGMSFYVDRNLVRHWIRTTADWSCAHWNLGAPEIPVRGFINGRHVLGPAFVCPG